MRYWMLYAGMITWGLIWIAGGLALQTPNFSLARWGCLLLGGAFVVLGTGALIGSNRLETISLPPDSQRVALVLGWSLVAAGGVGATYIAVAYPFTIPEWAGQAPWIGWVFFSGLAWCCCVGIALVLIALKPQ